MFAVEQAVALDPWTAWAGAFTALAVTGGMICQIVLQFMTKGETSKIAIGTQESAIAALKLIN